MADGVGGGSPGDGVGVETGAAALIERVGDGFAAVGGEGLHAAAKIASNPATTAKHRRGTSHFLPRSNVGPLRRERPRLGGAIWHWTPKATVTVPPKKGSPA